MGIEPLLNGSAFSPRGLIDACLVLRSQGSTGRGLSAYPGVALLFRTKEGWLEGVVRNCLHPNSRSLPVAKCRGTALFRFPSLCLSFPLGKAEILERLLHKAAVLIESTTVESGIWG